AAHGRAVPGHAAGVPRRVVARPVLSAPPRTYEERDEVMTETTPEATRPAPVLITGAAAGIGEAAARRVAAAGARVYALDRDADALARLVDDLPDAVGLTADLADPGSVAAAFARVSDDGGRLSGLVCAAGIQSYGTVDAADAVETFDRTFAVNVRGVFVAAHHAVPMLRANGGGSVVVVSSVQAY